MFVWKRDWFLTTFFKPASKHDFKHKTKIPHRQLIIGYSTLPMLNKQTNKQTKSGVEGHPKVLSVSLCFVH